MIVQGAQRELMRTQVHKHKQIFACANPPQLSLCDLYCQTYTFNILSVLLKKRNPILHIFRSECEHLRAEVLSLGAGQLASAAQVRDLRRKIALLTVSGAKQAVVSPVANTTVNTSSVDKIEIPLKNTAPLKKLTPDDVKKKVSFN